MGSLIRTAGVLIISCSCALGACATAAHADSDKKLKIHRVLCDIYDKEHDSKDEATEYLVLSQLAPNDAQIQYSFGLFLSRQKEYQPAIAHLKRATQIDASAADYWVQLGNEYMQIRNFQAAADAFHSAGPKYKQLEDRNRDYIQQLKQYQDYKQKLKDQQED
jgi:Tfp pilus assembly protein PilF